MVIKFCISEIDLIVKKYFIPKLKKYEIFTFKGPLGAGKTTLVRQILRACGVEGNITSPTFNYVNKYVVNDKLNLYHFDLYRLNSLESFIDSGFDECFYDDDLRKSICFIEWPEVIEPLLSSRGLREKVCSVTLGFEEESLDLRVMRFLDGIN